MVQSFSSAPHSDLGMGNDASRNEDGDDDDISRSSRSTCYIENDGGDDPKKLSHRGHFFLQQQRPTDAFLAKTSRGAQQDEAWNPDVNPRFDHIMSQLAAAKKSLKARQSVARRGGDRVVQDVASKRSSRNIGECAASAEKGGGVEDDLSNRHLLDNSETSLMDDASHVLGLEPAPADQIPTKKSFDDVWASAASSSKAQTQPAAIPYKKFLRPTNCSGERDQQRQQQIDGAVAPCNRQKSRSKARSKKGIEGCSKLSSGMQALLVSEFKPKPSLRNRSRSKSRTSVPSARVTTTKKRRPSLHGQRRLSAKSLSARSIESSSTSQTSPSSSSAPKEKRRGKMKKRTGSSSSSSKRSLRRSSNNKGSHKNMTQHLGADDALVCLSHKKVTSKASDHHKNSKAKAKHAPDLQRRLLLLGAPVDHIQLPDERGNVFKPEDAAQIENKRVIRKVMGRKRSGGDLYDMHDLPQRVEQSAMSSFRNKSVSKSNRSIISDVNTLPSASSLLSLTMSLSQEFPFQANDQSRPGKNAAWNNAPGDGSNNSINMKRRNNLASSNIQHLLFDSMRNNEGSLPKMPSWLEAQMNSTNQQPSSGRHDNEFVPTGHEVSEDSCPIPTVISLDRSRMDPDDKRRFDDPHSVNVRNARRKGKVSPKSIKKQSSGRRKRRNSKTGTSLLT